MPLQGLALQVYQILRRRVPGNDPRLSYQDVVTALGPLPTPNDGLKAHDPRLSHALGEIGRACRGHEPPLPALSAIVSAEMRIATWRRPARAITRSRIRTRPRP